ncbi:MAG: hypothetical protein U1E36_00015 [Rickettsiales bacterium]
MNTNAANPLETINTQLTQLKKQFGKYIEEESLQDDIDALSRWIDDYHSNKPDAAEYLQEHGPKMLENITKRLKFAAEEMQRIEQESPAAAQNFSGGKADRLHKAATVTEKAQEHLGKALEEENA